MPRKPTATASLERDLKQLPPALRDSGLAGVARAMAKDLDAPDTPATARAACARSMIAAMRELRSLTPATVVTDEIDELQQRREAPDDR